MDNNEPVALVASTKESLNSLIQFNVSLNSSGLQQTEKKQCSVTGTDETLNSVFHLDVNVKINNKPEDDNCGEQCAIDSKHKDACIITTNQTSTQSAWDINLATGTHGVDNFLPVHSLRVVEQGDHLAWWRPEGYWHHALVEKVYIDTHELLVLHYNGPSPNGLVLCKGKVVQEMLKINEEKGLLYKIVYCSKFSIQTIITRAKTRLGEEKYNIFSCNCEHYVRWCKTGSGESCVSVQVQGFYWTAFRITQKVFTCLSKDMLKFGIGRLSAETVYVSSVEHAPIKALFGGTITWPTVALLCEYFGIFFILFIELLATALDVRRFYKLSARRALSKVELTTKVFRRVSQGLGGAGGAVIGALLGQAFIPIPFVGGLLGSTLGAVLGHYLGHFEGYAFAYIQRKLSKDHQT